MSDEKISDIDFSDWEKATSQDLDILKIPPEPELIFQLILKLRNI
jgi:hypothetical protein